MASLLLGDLNDYIAPSQACVLPVKNDKEKEGKPVTVNLNDCLACSGCITSAETVLVAQQTHSQFYEALEQKGSRYKRIVVSVSPQTRTALAVRYRLSAEQVHARLLYFFKDILGVDTVIDTTFARSLVLELVATEFLERFREKSLPVLTSACPGWICFAEKKQGELLPLISKVRSPQQASGVLVKEWMSKGLVKREEIFHMSIMPCYDKKLEASRDDFSNGDCRDVDCVITTSELLTILDDKLSKDTAFTDLSENSERLPLYSHSGSGAGGYLEYTLNRAAKQLYDIDLNDPAVRERHLRITLMRNRDHTEYRLISLTGETVLTFAALYGFRNIQTFVQKRKIGSVSMNYDFVEVMACPGACLFGGGQPEITVVDSDDSRSHKEAYRTEMERMYASLSADWPPSVLAQIDLVKKWIDEDPETRRPLFYTSYRSLLADPSKKKHSAIVVQW